MKLLDIPNLDIGDIGKRPSRQGMKRKLLRHAEGDDYILEMDHSSMESFLTCDRSAQWKLVFGRQKPPGSAVTYGSAWHAALERHYRQLSFNEAISAAEQVFVDNPPPLGEWRTFDHFLAGFKQYTTVEYPTELFEIVHKDDLPLIEIPFAVPLGVIAIDAECPWPKKLLVMDCETDEPSFRISRLHIVWTGVSDMVVRQNDRLHVMDHKTTSILGDSFFAQFTLSQQLIGYAYAMRTHLGEPINNAIVNALVGRAPTVKGKGTPREFHRRYYQYRDDQYDEWRQDMLNIISNFMHNLVTGYFPKKTSWCINKFGTCPYMDVCSLEPELRLIMLDSSAYDDNRWNPID